MKRFTFRLQILLDQAQRKEEDELRSLAAHLRERETHLGRIAHTQAARERLCLEIHHLHSVTFEPWVLHGCHLRREVLGNDLAKLQDQLAEIDDRVRRQQLAVAEAMKRRQALDNLREQQYDTFRKEQETQELKEMEELVLPRHARKHLREQAPLG